MEPNPITLFVSWYVVFVISITLHEGAHALVAWKLGDSTAYHAGQVTLDPLAHIQREPIGTVVMPLITFFWMGWMMGWASAPYDPQWALRHPRRAAWMALAGPVANLLLAILAGLAIRLGMWADVFTNPESISTDLRMLYELVVSVDNTPFYSNLAMLVSIMFALNLLLFLFNLLPVPPLDGGSVIMLLMPDETARRYIQSFLWQPQFQLFGLLIAWRVLSPVLWPALLLAVELLYGTHYG